jgi:hypothetical protein
LVLAKMTRREQEEERDEFFLLFLSQSQRESKGSNAQESIQLCTQR